MFLLFSCTLSSNPEKSELKNPYVLKAQQKVTQQDIDAAIGLYQKGLDEYPDLALAHLRLALLFDEEKEDYVRALYHYQRYIELRPDAEKRRWVENAINRARMSFAASFKQHSTEAIAEVARLKEENARLKTQVETLNRKVEEVTQQAEKIINQVSSQTTPPKPVVPREPVEPPPTQRASINTPAEPAPQQFNPNTQTAQTQDVRSRTHVVQAGETLTKISRRQYGTTKYWREIYNANRDKIPGNFMVRPGQVLTIPEVR